ncbi:hypothetical protein EDC04DRAFT_2610685 [Pisolithus marmoratus]|nr:hypothetical protein EDC04DRAFT_2610685 [Pisolithus marmoratus]
MPGKVEAHLINEQTQAGKESRQVTHCHNVGLPKNFNQAYANYLLEIRVPWQWLGHLIKTLGKHGMSSEESAVENGVENVLCGSCPLHRIHATENPTTKWDAVKGLLLALYDGAWIASLTECQKESLEILTAPFPWMKVAVV